MKWLANLIHSIDRKNRHYISEADRMLKDFDESHPFLSASQQKEIKKYDNLFRREVQSRIKWD